MTYIVIYETYLKVHAILCNTSFSRVFVLFFIHYKAAFNLLRRKEVIRNTEFLNGSTTE